MKTKFYAVAVTEPLDERVAFYTTRTEALAAAIKLVKRARRSEMRKAHGESCVKMFELRVEPDSQSLAAKAATVGRTFRIGEYPPVLGAQWDDSAQARIDKAWKDRLES